MTIKDNSLFKTLRHIEAVRNYLDLIIRELLFRGENHDQSKLQSPEMEMFKKYTPKLRDITYNSKEYKECMEKMKDAITHHHSTNKHHPEHYVNGISDMTLIDLMEMLCDWKASSMRHNNGNLLKSIEVNQEKFKFSEELAKILQNTAMWIDSQKVNHYAQES
jgi:hypothetical protein